MSTELLILPVLFLCIGTYFIVGMMTHNKSKKEKKS